MFFPSDSRGFTFLAQSLQHPWPKGVVGDLGPSAVILGKFTCLPYFIGSITEHFQLSGDCKGCLEGLW